jgi:formamidopyrimidine-DNA glycosylase
MLEIPEAYSVAKQIRETIKGKKIQKIIMEHSPHKFAWYYGEPDKYEARLKGKTICDAQSFGSLVQIYVEGTIVLFGDGVALRYFGECEKRPSKHQMLIEFEDGTALSGSVQMYGGLWCFKEGEFDNPYYLVAMEKPSPLSDEFSFEYFNNIFINEGTMKLSLKAFLATEQRIPGLGNGVLQDILFKAGFHPRKKINTLNLEDKNNLFSAVKSVLCEMVQMGGRDTEKNLFGLPGGYRTRLSKNTVDKPCAVCGNIIKKENYLGGSIYFCETCQKQ